MRGSMNTRWSRKIDEKILGSHVEKINNVFGRTTKRRPV
jgi:hypothetical protein